MSVRVIHLLEEAALDPDLSAPAREAVVRGFGEVVLEILAGLRSQDADIQHAVDVSVAYCDVSQRVGCFAVLNEMLERLQPDRLPAPVAISWAVSTKLSQELLPARQDLIRRLERHLWSTMQDSADDLTRWIK